MDACSDRADGALLGERQPCVLVVEDEMIIRLMVSDALREVGYEVVEACSGDEALALLSTSLRVDLVFSDVRMPGALDGIDLLRQIRATRPDLPFIIASADFDPARAVAEGATRALRKPYQFSTVVQAVGDALAGAA